MLYKKGTIGKVRFKGRELVCKIEKIDQDDFLLPYFCCDITSYNNKGELINGLWGHNCGWYSNDEFIPFDGRSN